MYVRTYICRLSVFMCAVIEPMSTQAQASVEVTPEAGTTSAFAAHAHAPAGSSSDYTQAVVPRPDVQPDDFGWLLDDASLPWLLHALVLLYHWRVGPDARTAHNMARVLAINSSGLQVRHKGFQS